MKEFMLLIYNEGDAKLSLSPTEHHAFIKKCEEYITALKKQNKLIAAQPLLREGFVISKEQESWKENSIATNGKIQVGYYHIFAADIHEATSIAKDNPEFAYVPSASIEVRRIKTKETETSFVYPVNQ